MISWLIDGPPIIKVFAGLLLRLQQVSSNNFWTTCASFLHEFGSDDSALYMALVRVLVVLYAGDGIVVLPTFFHSWYHFCYSVFLSNWIKIFLPFQFVTSWFFFLVFLSLPIHPFDFAKYFFCLSTCDGNLKKFNLYGVGVKSFKTFKKLATEFI